VQVALVIAELVHKVMAALRLVAVVLAILVAVVLVMLA
jgi:hypothetical protein